VQPYLGQLYGAASNWYNGSQGQQANAGTPGDLSQAFNMIRSTAGQASPTLGTAQNATNWLANGGDMTYNPYANGQALKDDPTANGAFLGQQNPYLRGMVESASRPITENFMNAVAPSLASQFSMAGRMGSGSHLAAAQQALEHKTLPDGAHTAPHCQEFRTPAQPLHAEHARRRKPQADSRLRPRARRAESTLRPPVVAIRVRKPWRRLRTSLLG